MKTIKIIDLFVKIANGEDVPKKIKYLDDIYIYQKQNREGLRYVNLKQKNRFRDLMYSINYLWEEVEIIEDKEDKNIEEIKINYDEFYKHYIITTTINGKKYNSITNSATDKIFCGKINEIIDFINEGRDEE